MDFKQNKNWLSWHEQQPHESADMLQKLWVASDSYKNDFRPNGAEGFAALKNRMNQHQPTKIVRLSPIKIALRIAAGVAVLLVAIFFLKDQFGGSDQSSIALTPANETKEISLSDGSVVAMNQSSRLTYKAEFAKEERGVSLEGEAFFKIARDENRPFVIETETAQVSVLGTSFNLRSYPKEDFFEVYVETGKVKVSFNQAKEILILNPGEFVRFSKTDGKALKGKDKSGMPNAWRTGTINFKGQTIPAILMGMERLYGVKFDLQTDQKPDCFQTLTVQKGRLAETIEVLETSCPKLKFAKSENGEYVVTGVCCN